MNKKTIGLMIALIISIIAISGCIFEEEPEELVKEFNKEGLSFKYPESFTLTQIHDEAYNSPVVDYLLAETYNDYDTGQMLVIISKSNDSLEQMYSGQEDIFLQYGDTYEDYTLERVTINGMPAIKITTELLSGTDGQYRHYAYTILLKQNNIKYYIKLSAVNDLHSLEGLYDKITTTIEIN